MRFWWSVILALFILVGASGVSTGAELVKKEKGEYGTTYWGKFKRAPFPSPGAPYKDNTIAIFVPEHFCPLLMRVKPKKGRSFYRCYDAEKKKEFEKKGYKVRRYKNVDYVVHFHGHSNTVAKAMRNHRLREQFALSLQNAILVVPQGPVNAVDSQAGKLEREGGFKRMMFEVHRFLRDQGVIGEKQYIGHLILTSHSGGYRATARCLEFGGLGVNEVFLFDSLYSYTDVFLRWIQERESNRFINLYYRDKPRARSKELMAMLKAAGVAFTHLTTAGMKKKSFKRKNLARSRILFVDTELGHSGCTRNNFNYRDYLFSSRLKRAQDTNWFEKRGLDKLKLDQ